MYIKLRLRPDAGWVNPDNAGKVYEGQLLKREESHIPGVEWLTVDVGEEINHVFRSDIVEVLDEGDVGNPGSNGT